MIKLHDKGVLHEFADADAIIAHFTLDALTPCDLRGITAASDANWPLHAAIDPCIEELREKRVLLLEVSANELRAMIKIRQEDI